MAHHVLANGLHVSGKCASAVYGFALAAYADLAEAGRAPAPRYTAGHGYDTFAALAAGSHPRDRGRKKKTRRPFSISRRAKEIFLVFFRNLVFEAALGLRPGSLGGYTLLVYGVARRLKELAETPCLARDLGSRRGLDCAKYIGKGGDLVGKVPALADNATEYFLRFLKCVGHRIASRLAEPPLVTLNETTLRVILRDFTDLVPGTASVLQMLNDDDLEWSRAAARMTPKTLAEYVDSGPAFAGPAPQGGDLAGGEAELAADSDLGGLAGLCVPLKIQAEFGGAPGAAEAIPGGGEDSEEGGEVSGLEDIPEEDESSEDVSEGDESSEDAPEGREGAEFEGEEAEDEKEGSGYLSDLGEIGEI